MLRARVFISLCLALSVLVGLLNASASSFFGGTAWAATTPNELKGIGITEKLGQSVAIDKLSFRDETGQTVPLSKYFSKGKPVLLAMVYYNCPSLCNLLLNGTVDSLKPFKWTPGKEFELVTVSIEPKETAELAAAKKASYVEAYGRPEAAEGWHFLTGTEENVRALADQIGFGYRWDEASQQYAHGAALFALSPTGKITRYLYGIQFSERDLRLALMEASDGKVGTVLDRVILFCFRYDPISRKYSLYLTKLMQVACGITVLVLGTYLLLYWRRQRKGALSSC